MRTNVAQCWVETLFRWSLLGCQGQYFRIVRGDTKMPSLSESSSATRAWPHVGVSRAIRTINSRTVCGTGGLPRRDFQRQKSLKPFRCQPASLGFDNHESPLPVEQSGPQHQTQSRRIGQRLRSDLVFSVERQLLAKEQVLRNQRGARSERRFQEGGEVGSEGGNKGRECGSGLHRS